VQLCRLLLLASVVSGLPAFSATVLVLQFQNHSQYADLNWVGESIAEKLMGEYAEANQIVLDRASRAEGMRRLSLRSDANFTKATLIRLGESLDVDYLCYGTYDVKLANTSSELKNSSVQISARFLDLRKMHDGPEVSETGNLSELSRLEEHLAFTTLKYLDPKFKFTFEQFVTPAKLVRVDAEESYVRGLLSPSGEQQQKWLMQAAALDPHFSGPVFELGKLALARKNYREALTWFQRITPAEPRYPEARFKMGLSAYGAGDYNTSANYFRELLKTYPLNEVYNNLGAAEAQLNQPAGIDDLRRAAEGDPNDPTYLFNLGLALLKANRFDEAAKQFQAALDHNANDSEARTLLARAQNRQSVSSDAKTSLPERLKLNFDATAFRQLKAMVQPKGSEP
jgi:tetratricopeptide (TPR) repeat protein